MASPTEGSFDLYRWLGVDKNASAAEIKKAHRKRAKDTHPDMDGGNPADFEKTQKALAVLTDEQRRRHYDATGEMGEGPVDNDVSDALTQLSKCFRAACEDVAGGAPPDAMDLVSVSRQIITRLDAANEKKRSTLKRLLESVDTLAERFTHEGDGRDYMKLVFSGERSSLMTEIGLCDRKARSNKLALEILKDYSYRWKDPSRMLIWGYGVCEFGERPFGGVIDTSVS